MASSHLMSEEDVREYFLQNNGIVRNTDIVNYFRPYLSDPNIRDEARVLFKSYVNKLANVKTENGEKFLVLKRQYFHPIDGNGNGRPVSGISNSYSQQLPPYSSPPNPYNNPYPPPVRNDPVQLQQQHSLSRPTLQRTLSQQSYSMSQSQLYGSAFSLSSVSNYGDPYYGNPLASNNNNTYSNSIPTYPSNVNIPPPAYPPPPVSYPAQQQGAIIPDYNNDYGLPPVPSNPMAPPRRYPTSPPSLTSSLSSTSLNMINPVRMPPPYRPPPYRPPPPGPRYPSAPPQQTQQAAAPILRNPINFPPRFPHPPSVQMSQNNNYHSEPPTPTTPALAHHQYQRSLSVPGALIPGQEGSSSGYSENSNNSSSSAFPTPPPPVPPRSKRGGFGGPVRAPGGMAMSDADDDGGFESLRSERSNSMGAEAASSGSKIPIVELRRSNSEGASLDDSTLTANDIDNKENVDLANGNTSGASGSSSIDNDEEGGGILNGNCVNGNVNSDVEQKISVKERLQKFNRIASESELAATSPPKMPSAARSRRENPNKHDSVDFDTASLSSFGFSFAHMQPKDKEWILKAANSDYHALNKMAQENASLVKKRDMNYTALHWAAKHGNAELVKLLAGTHKSDINCKSNGGYTPLHLAAQFSRQEVYDILVQVYNADVNVRDHSGKKPMQYLVRQDTTVSMDTFKKLKEKRRSHEQRESFLRIGSLNVRVKKTTEAFGNFLGKSNSSASIERILHKSWGSADNIPEAEGMEKDKQMMPPPSSGNGVRRVTSKVHGKRRARKSAPASDSPTATIKESVSDSDSDTACGFGYEWQNGS